MKAKYYSVDDVEQIGEEDFQLNDVFHYCWFPSIPKLVFQYSEARGEWNILPADNIYYDHREWKFQNISDLPDYLLIKSVLELSAYDL